MVMVIISGWTRVPVQKGYLRVYPWEYPQVDQPADPAHPYLRILEDPGFKFEVEVTLFFFIFFNQILTNY